MDFYSITVLPWTWTSPCTWSSVYYYLLKKFSVSYCHIEVVWTVEAFDADAIEFCWFHWQLCKRAVTEIKTQTHITHSIERVLWSIYTNCQLSWRFWMRQFISARFIRLTSTTYAKLSALKKFLWHQFNWQSIKLTGSMN